jgi:hypothetical protein
LHSEGKIRKAVVPRQNFARETERSHIKTIRSSAIPRWYDRSQPTCLSQGADEIPARTIHVGVIDVLADMLLGPRRQGQSKLPMRLAEEGPIKMRKIRHQCTP